ncbi:MAG: S4 domain-containing protein [Bacteroidota bacterium]|nr:S4 domain-containing protein [Bacteroidota bacterium]MEC7549084.1 S4 domain-containing protein [Bacteroidota bacterium]MEC7829690.1 S4 domain-containing protein [Bacteroidota bacterium]MEC8363583.1 S4 domain-containing protein [Bacteroidota bacterium]MEC9160892.1 S4 domain-containing protein [Bacteroidota bacterium]
MRIDKFLWATRFFKSRSLAAISCKKGNIKLNGIKAKASKEVYISDEILVRKNQIFYNIMIIDLPNNRISNKKISNYYKNIETQEMKEKKNLIVANKILKTPKSERKPTKKNRRELISFLENKN